MLKLWKNFIFVENVMKTMWSCYGKHYFFAFLCGFMLCGKLYLWKSRFFIIVSIVAFSFKFLSIIFPSTTKSYGIPSYSGVILKSSGIVFLFSGFCITVTSPFVSNIAYSTSTIEKTSLTLNLSCNSLIVTLDGKGQIFCQKKEE